MNRCKERKRSLSNVFLNIIKLPEFPRYDFCFSENGLVAYQGCQLLGQSSILGKLGENTQGIETGISILANHIKKIHNHLCSTLGTGVDPPRPVRTMSPFLLFFFLRASLRGIVELGKSQGQTLSLCVPLSVKTPTTFEILDKCLLSNENWNI